MKSLRRPTVVAWALNQLARRRGDEVAMLLESGRDLASAQRAAASGRGAQAFREATAGRRALIGKLAESAVEILQEAGKGGDPHRTALAATLEAASVDDASGKLLRRGRLTKELTPVAFAGLEGLSLEEAPGAESGSGRGAEDARRETEEAPRRARARREAEELERGATEARERAERLGREADVAAERARALEADAREARDRARELVAAARDAETEARKATAAAERAARRLGGGAG